MYRNTCLAQHLISVIWLIEILGHVFVFFFLIRYFKNTFCSLRLALDCIYFIELLLLSCCCCCCYCWNLQNLYRAFHLFIIPTSLARRCGGHARLLLHHVRVFCRLNFDLDTACRRVCPKGCTQLPHRDRPERESEPEPVHERESWKNHHQPQQQHHHYRHHQQQLPQRPFEQLVALCCYFVYLRCGGDRLQ